ncbi:MAG: phosphate ABC transporter permease PstA, partial [Gammaproteobacteria bacterium]
DYVNANGEAVRVIGETHSSEEVTAHRLRTAGVYLPDDIQGLVERRLVKVGNREVYGSDFLWMVEPKVSNRHSPENIVVLERHEWGNFYGYLKSVKKDGQVIAQGDASWQDLQPLLERSYQLHEQIKEIEKDDIGAINYGLERLRLKRRGLELDGVSEQAPYDDIKAEKAELEKDYAELQKSLNALYEQIKRDSLVMEAMNGKEVEIQLAQVVYAFKPNAMGAGDKIGHYFHKIGEFIFDEPREANTEGGIFPAIFGTVMMVILMAVLVTPFGVVAAVYLREYAKQGPLTRTIRVAVNNLAGVPSIVYGVFGLGFFVYFLGGSIDELFFPEAYPAPTFGTPGILWSSLTLAILTLPVVIVSTEEGLSRIPRSLREGSLALGATHFETIWKVILPMASPAMMTGLILAVARAAGEVAPLMLVGVVKLAPTLPLDGNFPYLHLERKFMHLGFHIYDVGFQSPNVEAARPLVYATAFLLVLVIIGLNLSAVGIRNRLREKYRQLDH